MYMYIYNYYYLLLLLLLIIIITIQHVIKQNSLAVYVIHPSVPLLQCSTGHQENRLATGPHWRCSRVPELVKLVQNSNN